MKQVSLFGFTSFVTVLHRPGDPLDGFGRDFGAEVSVKGRRSSSLSGDGRIRLLKKQQLMDIKLLHSETIIKLHPV